MSLSVLFFVLIFLHHSVEEITVTFGERDSDAFLCEPQCYINMEFPQYFPINGWNIFTYVGGRLVNYTQNGFLFIYFQFSCFGLV